jgi:hypothetical protein
MMLPKPFQQYAFYNIGSSLGHQLPDIAEAMTTASVMLQQTGGSASLGKHSSSLSVPKEELNSLYRTG